jgi:hypothetical protein
VSRTVSYALKVVFRGFPVEVRKTVAKKRVSSRSPQSARDQSARSPSAGDSPAGAVPDDARSDPAPEDAVERAWEELQRAEQAYRIALQGTTAEASDEEPLSAGDILDASLEFVRRHPAAGVLAACSIGFLFGRAIPR